MDRKFFTVDDLNHRLELFPYAQCDSISKPSANISLSTSDHSLKQNGTFITINFIHACSDRTPMLLKQLVITNKVWPCTGIEYTVFE